LEALMITPKSVRHGLVKIRHWIVRTHPYREAETVQDITRILVDTLGYDESELEREERVLGDRADIVVTVHRKPRFVIEAKREDVQLLTKQNVNQATKYALAKGLRWFVLSNAREWGIYRLARSPQGPSPTLAWSTKILDDDPSAVARCMYRLCRGSILKGQLDKDFETRSALMPSNLMHALLHQDTIRALRRRINTTSKTRVDTDELVGAIRELWNEGTVDDVRKELAGIRIKTAIQPRKKIARPQQPEPKIARAP
jgi:hypothetical protein